MNNFLKKSISKIIALTMLITCCCSFTIQQTSAASVKIIDPDTGNGSWSFLSADTTYLDTNLALSDEASKLVSIGEYTDSNSVTHKTYVVGGASNPSNLEYTYGELNFIGTADAAVTFRAYKGFGRVNLDPGASISVPVRGACTINVLMFVDSNPVSGSAGYAEETGETADGKLSLSANETEFASQSPITLSKGSNQKYSFAYSGEGSTNIKITNTGSKILAIAGISTKHVVQGGASVVDCSEAEGFVPTGNVYVVGDSTVCNYTKENSADYNYRQGWAMRLGDYLTEDVTVNNLALSGRSSRSFLSENNYTTLSSSMKTGDYLIIQWGHNDEKTNSDYTGPAESKYEGIYSVPISKIGNGTIDWTKSTDGIIDDGNGNKIPCFEWFLYNSYIKPARLAGAQPILVTPITRRDSSGTAKVDEKHELYAQAIRQLAADYNVPLVDLLYDSQNYWNSVGVNNTAALHALNATSTSKEVDNTHLSKEGASVASKFVATSIKRLGLKLANKITVVPEKVTEITLDSNALQTNVSKMIFKTVRDAMKFIETCNTPTSEEERVTLNFKKGTYREQIFVNAPYLTFKNAESTDYKDVILTWYYGIGYKYYSIGEDGFYSKDKARENKINDTYTAPCKNWGHTVRVNATATGFKADNITFESSFNRYVTEEELADGCVPVTVVLDSNKKVSNDEGKLFYSDGTGGSKPARTLNTNVTTKSYRERSCAFFVLADKAEMDGCYFVSEQDTLGTNTNRQYYKNCVIEGTVDYICGTGNSIFDNCELKWGTTASESGGYVSAPKGNYLFYNCKVTGNGNDKSNAWARPWGGKNSNATMFKTIITKNKNSKLNILGTGYSNMSSNVAAESKFYEYGSVDENGNAIDLSGRLKNTVQPFGTAVTDKWLMLEFNPYNYTTGKYGSDNPNVGFTPDDWDPMGRAERMAPIENAINFNLETGNEKIAYNSAENLYEVGTETIKLPEVLEGYERKIVSSSTDVKVSDDGNSLSATIPSAADDAKTVTLTVYYREKDSDEWGDKRVIDVKLTPNVETPASSETTTETTTESTTESSTETTTENTSETSYKKGDFNGDGNVDIDDAAMLLDYVLDPSAEKFKNFTEANFTAGHVTTNEQITAKDVAEILKKVLDENFVFSITNKK